MSEEEEVAPIVSADDALKFPDTITVSTAQVVAYQQGTERRIDRQRESINRVLGLLEESQQREAAAADEIARNMHEIGQLTEALRLMKVRAERAEQERDEVLATFGGMMNYLKENAVEFHTRDGDTVAAMVTKESFSVDATYDRTATLEVDPEDVVREAIPDPAPVAHPGESRPARHLAGD